jgi:MFS family permease
MLMIMISLGFGSSTKSLFPDEIAKDLGVERSLVSIGESCRYIAAAVVNLFFGALISKFGPKKLICSGLIALSFAMLLYSVADNLAMIYIAGSLLGIGFSWTTTTMVGYIVGIWCSENKGTVMGLILASNGLGGAIAIQIVGGLIDPNTVGSYRNAYRLIAIILACFVVVMLLFFRNRPKNMSLDEVKPSKGHGKKRGKDWVGIEFSDAVRKFYFWGILVCIFFTGLILQGTGGIVAMHFKDVGIDYGKVKSLLSFGSVILMGSKFFAGFLYDRIGLRFTASVCTLASILASFLLAVTQGNALGFYLALIYMVVSKVALPLETVMLPIFAADLFGQKSYVKVMGLFVSVSTAGYAVGAPLMNACYDIFASYVPALILVSVLMCFIFVLMQFVISAAHKEQVRILEKEITE